MVDIPTGGTKNIKNMWEKGNVGSSSESPAPANKVREPVEEAKVDGSTGTKQCI